MPTDPTQSFSFFIDFGEHGGKFEWDSLQAVIDWINLMNDGWVWLSENGGETQEAWGRISRQLQAALTSIRQAEIQNNQGQLQNFQNHIQGVTQQLQALITPYPWLLPNNAKRQFVENLRDAGKKLVAGLIVSYWMQIDLREMPTGSVIAAVVESDLYDRGITARCDTENAALQRLAGDMQTELTKYQQAERTQTENFNALKNQFDAELRKQQGVFETAQATRDETWQTKLDNTQAELNTLKTTYDEHMTIAAPVDYWTKKRKKHSCLTIGLSIAIVICMTALGGFLHWEIQNTGNKIESMKTLAVAQVTKNTPAATETNAPSVISQMTSLEPATTWRIGSLVLLATLGFWFIRLLVRVFLSNLHLQNDAEERVTMAQTYLAMIRSESLPKGENISTVLAALFRPTGDGIVKDEGLPPTAMEWMTKLGGK